MFFSMCWIWNQLIHIFLEKNKKLNLSAIRDEEGVRIKHIQDSLQLLETWLFTDWKFVIDIGTGWWFPLVPLALSCPDLHFLGIDSVRKKTVAVNEILDQLWVKNAKVLWTRIEEYTWEKADIITARAVAYSDKLLKRSYPLLKKGGYFVFMKQEIAEERELLFQLCKRYHLILEQERKYQLFEWDIQRVIYVLRKL